MLAWVSMAPLGRPVVPDVYMIRATDSGSTSAGGGTVEAGQTHRSDSQPADISVEVNARTGIDSRIRVDRRPADPSATMTLAPASPRMNTSSGPVRRKFNGTKIARRAATPRHRLEERRLVEAQERDPVADLDPPVPQPAASRSIRATQPRVRDGRALERRRPGRPASLSAAGPTTRTARCQVLLIAAPS